MAFGRNTPPAGFPVLLGGLGLGVAWRTAGTTYQSMQGLGEILLGAGVALFLAGFSGYALKVARRPTVMAEDMLSLPGRAGLAAMMMCWMLVAASLVPYAPDLAKLVLIGSIALHVGTMLLAIRVMAGLPAEARPVTPVWHLTFVGTIVAAVTAAALGWQTLAAQIYGATLLAAALIYFGTLILSRPGRTPAALRPILAIHLGPVSLFATAAVGLGWPVLAYWFGWLALACFLILTARVLWLIAGGFSALWGAFTFPLSAFAVAMLLLSDRNPVFEVFGLIALLAATLIIPPIALKVMQLWLKGKLAAATNAASV